MGLFRRKNAVKVPDRPGVAGGDVMEMPAAYRELIDRLADPDPDVRTAAAELSWRLHRDVYCGRAVMFLRNEIRGRNDRAVVALDALLAAAPDDDARAGLQALIDEHVVIADRFDADPDLVLEFIEKVQRRQSDGTVATYEAYRGANRQQAISYLNAHPITADLYYLEVETPDGTFGRDIGGIYDL